MKAYLAGAIEYAPDLGKKWRDEMALFLQNELNHSAYNPLLEENKYLTQEELETFRELKVTHLDQYKVILRKLIDGDLKALKESIDYIICLWDTYTEKGGGTYGELTVAYEHGIPVYMVTEKLKPEISGWIIGCTTEIFHSFNELKIFLRNKYALTF
ncbi:MAG: hypothetical protein JXQ65_09655 [Candidatus Marinimicrobia bacterium]|nr:hypothetical protein [Candidatus Neomarinimicrobiota bacterium]